VPERVLDMLPFVDYIRPNSFEAQILSGQADEEEQIAFLLDKGCRSVVLKKGGEGSRFISDEEDVAVPAFALKTDALRDSTGAGDSFNAGFLYGVLDGKTRSASLKMGNAAGYLMITAPGGPLDLLSRKDLADEIDTIIRKA
jgi:sugar/nucleoside kinase (ribokinase family)